MRRSFAAQSGRLSDLRETNVKLCGRLYSKEFIDRLQGKTGNGGSSIKAAFVGEYIAVGENGAGEIVWETAELPREETKAAFHSAWGDFISNDMGEFGGTLVTPNETLRGNFCEIFALGDSVCGIDSLNHMSISHLKIYRFAEDRPAELLYDSSDIGRIELAALDIRPGKALVLAAGMKFSQTTKFGDCTPVSYLFEITEDGFRELACFGQYFDRVYNIFLKDNKLMIGRDKVVTVADITTGGTADYTPLTAEAEEDILRTNR